MGSLRLLKDFLTRFHRRRAFFASRFHEEMLRRFAVFWAQRSTTFLRERGSSLIYCLASSFSMAFSVVGLPLRGGSCRLFSPCFSHFFIHVETVSLSTSYILAMALIVMPSLLSKRPWARIRARCEASFFIVFSKRARCCSVR